MLQQLDDLDRQRRKPIFTERKIGKSVSVNSHLGFPLKVLEELTERDELGSPQKQKKEKTPFLSSCVSSSNSIASTAAASHLMSVSQGPRLHLRDPIACWTMPALGPSCK